MGGVVAIALIVTVTLILCRGSRRQPEDGGALPGVPALLGIEYSSGRSTSLVELQVHPQELEVRPQELDGRSASSMVELLDRGAAREGSPLVQ